MNLFDNAEKTLTRPPEVLDILMYPHPLLKEVSSLIVNNIVTDQTLQTLIGDMRKTLLHYRALGLAAVQVGVPVRLLLVREVGAINTSTTTYPDFTEFGDKIHVIINPIIKSTSGSQFVTEGCLSVPGVTTRILRPRTVEIEYLDQYGYKHKVTQHYSLAQAILHEMDHLNGLMFFDKMNSIQKNSALKKLKVIKRKMI